MRDILDTIDGALADYATSPEAMRWSPEPPTETEPFLPAYMWEMACLAREFYRAVTEVVHLMDRIVIAPYEPPPEATPLADEMRTKLGACEPDFGTVGLANWPSGDLPMCLIKGDA